jgi:hypothetical protein
MREKTVKLEQSLSRLIELSKGVQMSAKQQEEQRNSFVYGNTRIENSSVTREMVDQIAKRVPNKWR